MLIKKLTTLMLILVMCFNLCVPAQANGNNSQQEDYAAQLIEAGLGEGFLQDDLICAVSADIEAVNDVGLSSSRISILDVDEFGNVLYSYQVLDSLQSTIRVEKNEDGTIILDVIEGNCHDILEVRKDGTMLLDGQEIIISLSEALEDSLYRTAPGFSSMNSINSNIYAGGTRERVYQETPFSSMQSRDFTIYVGNYNVPDVETEKKIVSISITVLTGIMSTAIGIALGGIPGSIVGAVIGGAISIAAGEMKTMAEQYAPDTAHFSFKQYQYEHKSLSTPIDRYYQYIINFYVKKNYEGTPIIPATYIYEHDYIK